MVITWQWFRRRRRFVSELPFSIQVENTISGNNFAKLVRVEIGWNCNCSWFLLGYYCFLFYFSEFFFVFFWMIHANLWIVGALDLRSLWMFDGVDGSRWLSVRPSFYYFTLPVVMICVLYLYICNHLCWYDCWRDCVFVCLSHINHRIVWRAVRCYHFSLFVVCFYFVGFFVVRFLFLLALSFNY